MEYIFCSITFITIPFIIYYLCQRVSWLIKIGPIATAYILGILFHQICDLDNENLFSFQENFSSIYLLLAIPLLLFSINIKKEIRQNREVLKGFMIGLISLLIATCTGYFIFKDKVPHMSHMVGMVTGLYSGGTPNLASIKGALNIEANEFIMVHSLDFIIGSPSLFFFMTIAPRIFRMILPVDKDKSSNLQPTTSNVRPIYKEGPSLLKSLCVAIGVAVLSLGIGLLFPKNLQPIVIILLNTTIAILASSNRTINKLPLSYELGNIFIIGFSFILASMADLSKIDLGTSIGTFYFMMWSILISFVLHLLLAKLTNQDADKTLIAMVALYYSPAFVPVVTSSMKNKSILLYGIVIGMLGFIIGNYLGVSISLLLDFFA
ncbi:DUF819 family protein [Halosquirtibacter xylanolyticus]|uniref:DUF819 family protein n=1 Tax=Halosquirtibacter xylanolyticus TaxID=3374599 RepID=UPI00374A182C|nr:DUF819 family protein [Prolixibacteraceae bacterium]